MIETVRQERSVAEDKAQQNSILIPENRIDANPQNVVLTERSESDADEGMTLMDLIRIVGKHMFTAILVFVLVVVGVTAYTLTAQKKYTATAQLFASYNNTTADALDSSVSSQSTAGTYIATQLKSYPDLVKTEAVLQPVVDELNDNSITTDDLATMVTATNPTDTYMLNVSVEATNPEQSAQLANEVSQSLSRVVSSELYASGKKSMVKLSVVQKAKTPTSQSSPNTKLNIAVAVVAGIVLGIFAALVRDLLARKLQDLMDLQSIDPNGSIAGIIPKDEVLIGTKPVIVAKPDSPIAEEFRRMRTNLSFVTSKDGDKGRLIVITSSMPSEGKTTVSCNLAAALAENGASVLLIDADLRHPSVAHHLGIEGNVGLAHVLSGQMAPVDVVQNYWKPNLHILPAGKRPANASLLLNSDMMKMLVDQALLQYDYVIIDTAPLTVSNDAIVFGSWTSGIILVTARGLCRKKNLEEVADSLRTAKVPVLGFVFNFANPKKGHNEAYYYYYEDGAKRSAARRGRKH
mgnify:CR=1 FL=1